MTSHYEVLEVDPRARPDVVKAAYHALAAIHNLDRGKRFDAGTWRQIQEAWEVLSNEASRAAYDTQFASVAGKVIGDKYRVIRKIAEGGIGTTYYGEHIVTKKPVCIKHCAKVSRQHKTILMDEACAMWDLRHHSIPAVKDLLELPDGSIALVMSYIEGPTIEQYIQQHGRIDPVSVSWITERTLNALMYMHYHGVVHGDIKPQNIILQEESHQVIVVDFGLSMVKPGHSDRSIGYTEHFAPPEQIDKERLIPQSDFYSLGMTMIYMLGGGIDKVKQKQIPNDVPELLCDFIRSMIVRDKSKRPDWKAGKLFDSFQELRLKVFGSKSSGMQPIRGEK